jgi:hypothetical protein
MSLWNSIGTNPFLKTLFSQVAGVALGAAVNSVDTALQNPTGGEQAYLTAHPIAGMAYVIGVGLFHNLVSAKISPRAAAAPASPGNADPAVVPPTK